MRILLTGATGFVGLPTCRLLLARGHQVRCAVRRPVSLPEGATQAQVEPLGPDTDWRLALDGIETIIHLAARAHVMRDDAADPLAVFRHVNRDGAVRLAEQAAEAGVRRLVFVSSIKVNGEATPPDRPFTAGDAPSPADPYGIAKAEAEERLAGLASRTGLELAVIRPPLVHGPGAKGNLAALMGVLARGIPLPLASVRNRRSLVGVDNLAGALAFLAECPGARGTFLVCDGEDVSTPDLLRLLGAGLGRPARLLPCPPGLLALAGRVLGKGAAVARLTGSLVVDDSPLRALGWRPAVSLAEGLAAMAAARVSAGG